MFHLGGDGLPSYIVNSTGAVVQMDGVHQGVGVLLATGGDTSNLNPTEMALAQDIVNALAENRGFDGKPRQVVTAGATTVNVDSDVIATAVADKLAKRMES